MHCLKCLFKFLFFLSYESLDVDAVDETIEVVVCELETLPAEDHDDEGKGELGELQEEVGPAAAAGVGFGEGAAPAHSERVEMGCFFERRMTSQ